MRIGSDRLRRVSFLAGRPRRASRRYVKSNVVREVLPLHRPRREDLPFFVSGFHETKFHRGTNTAWLPSSTAATVYESSASAWKDTARTNVIPPIRALEAVLMGRSVNSLVTRTTRHPRGGFRMPTSFLSRVPMRSKVFAFGRVRFFERLFNGHGKDVKKRVEKKASTDRLRAIHLNGACSRGQLRMDGCANR
jgi:hypothetical protein